MRFEVIPAAEFPYSLTSISLADEDAWDVVDENGNIYLMDSSILVHQSVCSKWKSLFLVLTRPLDRESLSEHRLVLTASDGGRPALTGTVQLVISVLDANDNAPQFNQSVYKVQLPEDATPGTLVALVAATDPDEGINQEFSYSIVSSVPASQRDAFSIDPRTGKIQLLFPLDFEEVRLHELQIEARDKGFPPLAGHCSVELEVLDVNDNAPEVWVTSLSVPVSEDAALGTVVALLSVSDRDSGPNGRVRCAVRPPSPFGLVATFAGSYSLVLREALDRERVSEYEVEVRAEDGGAPPLRAIRGLRVPVSDVNDNAPAFSQAVYTVGSWSYSQRHSRSLCVATDGAGKSDLMVFSPNCPPPPGPAPKETPQDPPSLLDTEELPVTFLKPKEKSRELPWKPTYTVDKKHKRAYLITTGKSFAYLRVITPSEFVEAL
ncbi:UNVERIFIED_CONTAM: hypothetical protein H355_000784 [Colinus virginianus]|nr:hypothetical protein H355_000784 [Colinus virginianus]